MADNSAYWSQEQSNWYQHQPGPPPPPPQQHPPPPPRSYPTGPYSANAIPNDHTPPPPPQQQQAPPSQSQAHHYHHQQQQQQQHHHHHHQPQQQQQQLHHQQQHPMPHQTHSNHHQTNNDTHNQMLPNGLSNGTQGMQSTSSMPCTQPTAQTHPAATMNQYNPHSMNTSNIHHEPLAVPMQSTIDPSSGYQVHPQQPPQQQSYQLQQQPHQPTTPHPLPPPPIYAQPNSYPNMAPAPPNAPNSMHPSMQQQSPHQQPHYAPTQYSPPSYWNSGPMHNQPNYGLPPPQPTGSQIPIQTVATPPTPILDNNSGYHAANPQSSLPPPPPQQQPQQAQHPIPSNMPYDNRGASYNMNYQQSTPGYYGSQEVQAQPPDPSLSYDMSHQQQQQQPPNHQSNWSNGYYQQNQSPYPPSVMNSYSMPYNGTTTAPNHAQVPNPIQGPPQPNQPPHYQMHQPPQQSQQWPLQNQTKPVIERGKAGEKKPVKPRAPRKQSNPNAPSGRRKRPVMTEENKQSGYAKFYKQKRGEFPNEDFSNLSKLISDAWKNLSEDDRAFYAEDVSKKRKEMLKKKASQQAQNLLVQGIKDDGMIPGMKKEKT